ncbi:hypothetical protein ACFVVX_15140 [Kitasatospora sp. NPDC058170]|uniref:hypothetical protein n=1 Tax=Kitasatospora sp. NPDC058170 TaxID=3346364 RepID=UPI0036D99F4F
MQLVEALALARRGYAAGAARALDHADEAAAGLHPASNEPFGITAHAYAVTVVRAGVSLFLGARHKAKPYFEALAGSLLAHRTTDPSPRTAFWLLYAADMHLTLGEIDLAAHTVHRAINVTGLLSPGLARQYRQRIAYHAQEPAVQRALEHLADVPKASGPSGDLPA